MSGWTRRVLTVPVDDGEECVIRIRPFAGWCFQEKVVGDPTACVSPPYDQFDETLVRELEAKNPYNIARLIKAPSGGGPDPSGEHYRAASSLMRRWISEGALACDAGAAFYPYSQTYTTGSSTLTRNGFIGLGDLRDTGLFTHERVHTHVRDDRTQLRLATAADYGLIFMIYTDPERSIDRLLRDCESGSPLLTADQRDGSTHRLYRCSDPMFTRRIVEQMADLDCVIADGHHRTSAAFKAWEQTGDERWAYVMMAFFNADAPGMTVLPIHRAVRLDPSRNTAEVLERIAAEFHVHDVPIESESPGEVAAHLEDLVREHQDAGRIVFGLVGPDPKVGYLVETPTPLPAEWPWPEASHPSCRHLATAVFETGVLRRALTYTEPDIARAWGITFFKDSERVVKSVRSGDHQLGFILPPTPLASIFDVARAHQNLPQKSTYFFPKLLTGLVINRIDTLPLD